MLAGGGAGGGCEDVKAEKAKGEKAGLQEERAGRDQNGPVSVKSSFEIESWEAQPRADEDER